MAYFDLFCFYFPRFALTDLILYITKIVLNYCVVLVKGHFYLLAGSSRALETGKFHSDDVAMQRPDWSVTANQLRFKLRFLLFNAAQYRGIYIYIFFRSIRASVSGGERNER